MEAEGTHCICELYECPPHLLNDESFIKETLRDAVQAGFATLLREVSYKFDPQGVTALGLISESHIAIHTWPECGYAAADVFTCGERAKAEKACAHLIASLKPRSHYLRRLRRGVELVSEAVEAKRDVWAETDEQSSLQT